jgi:hypothetical protein
MLLVLAESLVLLALLTEIVLHDPQLVQWMLKKITSLFPHKNSPGISPILSCP